MLACALWSCSARDPAVAAPSSPAHCRRRCAAAAAALQVQMTHSWVSRANALATYAGTVLAVVCLAVTATGGLPADAHAAAAMYQWSVRLPVQCPDSKPVLGSMPPLYSLADYFHRATPVVHCDFVGTEGLQKEFGHDRVRAARSAALPCCCTAAPTAASGAPRVPSAIGPVVWLPIHLSQSAAADIT